MKRILLLLILSLGPLGCAQGFSLGYAALGLRSGGGLELGGGGYRMWESGWLSGGEGAGGGGWGYGVFYLGYAPVRDLQKGLVAYPRLGLGGARFNAVSGFAVDIGLGGDWALSAPRGLALGLRLGYTIFSGGAGSAYARVTLGGGGFLTSP